MSRAEHHARERTRGAVLVITLLSLLLLVGLLVWVINLGQQTNRRVLTQHAADATAAAGAGWVARSLNTVAMNNVAQARMIALVNVLDSLPMAVEYSAEDQRAILDAVIAQSSRSAPGFWVAEGLDKIREELEVEVAILEPMAEFFADDYDVRRMTYYDVPDGGGRGLIWQAMESLDMFSQATMENLGALAQLNAVRGGQFAASGADDDVNVDAFILPAVPDIPWQRGVFDDFERPVRQGRLPEEVDDPTTNRGPYDTVFGWRYTRYDDVTGYRVPGDRQVATRGRGNIPISRGNGGSDGRWVTTGRTPAGYRNFGPQDWMLRRLRGLTNNQLRHSRTTSRLWQIADVKRRYLWPSGRGFNRRIVAPQWVTSYPEARQIAEAGSPRIRETAFVVIELKSRYPRNHPNFGAAGSWSLVDRTWNRADAPYVRWIAGGRGWRRNRSRSGWVDPATWEAAVKVADYIWRDEWEYGVLFDRQIGIEPQVDAQGEPIVQPAYRIDDYIFAGVNIGPIVEVGNPHNFASKSLLPAPIDLDHNLVGHDEASRRDYLNYFAVARRSDRPLVWPSKFTGRKPYPYVVSLAQAEVFNNHSWDLWTQMWHAQLTAGSDYDHWLQTFENTGGLVGPVAGMRDDELEELFAYLVSVRELAPMMSH